MPEDIYQYDIKKNPQKYMTYMINMIKILEINNKEDGQSKEKKLFQFFPLRSSIIPKYIKLDTKFIVEIFIEEKKQQYLDNIVLHQNMLWNKFFKLDHKIFKMKNYKFNYMICTDGLTVSILFLHDDEWDPKYIKQKNIQAEKMKCAEMTKDEKKKYKADKEEQIKKAEKINREFNKQLKAKEQAIFLKTLIGLSKEEQKKLREERKKLNNIKKQVRIEFPYLDELNDDELAIVIKLNKIYIDPGKNNILYMMDDNGTILRYTNKQRKHETHYYKYRTTILNYKKDKNIIDIETELSKGNSKTCNFKKFANYIILKNKVNDKLCEKYEATIFRQYKWYGFINKKRTEAKLLDRIENTFGKRDTFVMMYGDWEVSKQMRNVEPTPMVGIKRKLHERFTIYNLDEFRTSCLNHKTEEYCSNMYITDNQNNSKKIHTVLTYKMENNRYGCVHRDKNSVNNMKKIVGNILKNGERPLKYQRSYKFSKELIVANPKFTIYSNVPVVSTPINSSGPITAVQCKPLTKSEKKVNKMLDHFLKVKPVKQKITKKLKLRGKNVVII